MTPELVREFASLGVTIDPRQVQAQDDGVFKVLEVNWPAVTAFLACETQWRVASTMAGVFCTGLDYAGVDAVLRRRGDDDAVFAGVQEIERGALEAMGERRERGW